VPVVTVVFDLGNVLVRWDRRYLYEQLIDDPVELDRFLDEILTLEENARLDRGMPLAELTADLGDRFPTHRALIDAFRHRWTETLGEVIEGSVAILEDLRALDPRPRLLALSNWGRDTFAEAEARLDFLRHFDAAVISGREGVVKPEPAIFELLCERHDVEPRDAVFIDDSAANVAAAAALGFGTIHFTDPGQCRRELRALGLDLPPTEP
jgi:2-haloacid dehalogenase